MAYWLFKCNPQAYDYIGAYTGNVFTYYNTPEHWQTIQRGDSAIIWVTGRNPHCFAIANIIGNPIPPIAPIPDLQFFRGIPNVALQLAQGMHRVEIQISRHANHSRTTRTAIRNAGVNNFQVPQRRTVHLLGINANEFNIISGLL